jgi:hypothetical protein
MLGQTGSLVNEARLDSAWVTGIGGSLCGRTPIDHKDREMISTEPKVMCTPVARLAHTISFHIPSCPGIYGGGIAPHHAIITGFRQLRANSGECRGALWEYRAGRGSSHSRGDAECTHGRFDP